MITLDKPVTVAQACRLLGVSERTLRRIIRQPEMQAQTLAEHRRTATGVRRSLLLTPLLMEQLFQYLIASEDAGVDAVPNGGNYSSVTQANTGSRIPQMTLAYERLLAEQESRIQDLQAAIAHERERNALLSEMLAALQKEREANAVSPHPASNKRMGFRKWLWHDGE